MKTIEIQICLYVCLVSGNIVDAAQPRHFRVSAKIIAGNIKVFIEWRRMKRRLDFPVQFGMLLSILKEHPSKAVETNFRIDLSFTITSKPEIETPITDAPYDFGVRIQFHIYFIPWDPFSLVFY